MKKSLGRSLSVLAVIVIGLSLGSCTVTQTTTSQPTIQQVQEQTVTPCEEDMPCWDCHTMGNKICGGDSGHGVGGAACADWEALMNQHNLENPNDQWTIEQDVNEICAGQNH